jgi:outer membrane protein
VRTYRSTWAAAMAAAVVWAGAAQAQQPTPAQPTPAPTAPAQPTAAPTGRALSIRDARALAVERTEDVAAARANERRARAQVRSARSAFLPQLGGSGSYERTIESEFEGLFDDAGMGMGGMGGMMDGVGELPFGLDNTWRLGLTLTQELWSFGRSLHRVSGARAGARQAAIAVGSAAAQAELTAAQAYYDALLADQLVAIADVTLQQAQETLRITQLGRAQGQTPEFDLLRAQVTRDNQQSVVTQRRSERELALVRLKQVTGLPLPDPIHLTTPLEEPAEVREADRLRPGGAATPSATDEEVRALTEPDIARAETDAARRAPVREARELLNAREAALGAARAERWPSLSLSSNYGIVNYPADVFPGTDDWRTNWTVGVFLTVPLFTGFRTVADIDAAAADVDEARARLRQTERAAAVDGLSAAQQLAVARSTWHQNARTVSQAERAYQIADLRFQQGISTHLDLVDARIQLDQARVNRARAAHDLRIARIRLELLPRLPLSGADQPASAVPAGQPAASQAAGPVAPTTPASQAAPGAPQ